MDECQINCEGKLPPPAPEWLQELNQANLSQIW
jgi:hypothetical protein